MIRQASRLVAMSVNAALQAGLRPAVPAGRCPPDPLSDNAAAGC